MSFSDRLSVLCPHTPFVECFANAMESTFSACGIHSQRARAATLLSFSAGASIGASVLYHKFVKWWYLVNLPSEPKGFTPGLQKGPFGDYFYKSGAGDEYKLFHVS